MPRRPYLAGFMLGIVTLPGLFLVLCASSCAQTSETSSTAAASAPAVAGVANSDKRTLEALVAFIKNPTGAMPKLYPQPLDEAEVNADGVCGSA